MYAETQFYPDVKVHPFLQPFTVAAVTAATVTAPYHTLQAVDTEAPCKGEIPGVQIEDLCEGCISLSNAEGLGLLPEKEWMVIPLCGHHRVSEDFFPD